MSINDQYNMGRIPLRPLALTDKANAQTKELIIDYKGDKPTYHIYITDAKDRTKAGPTAKPYGLYLVDVTYPQEFNLPKRECIGPIWMP